MNYPTKWLLDED